MFKTGIEFLDNQVGSLNPGFIILHEVVGAGGREFASTSIINNVDSGYQVHYIAITKSRDEVIHDLQLMFPDLNLETRIPRIRIHSFATYYFKESVVPAHWFDEKAIIETLKSGKGLIEVIVDEFEKLSECLVFLDSITDLARASKRLGRENVIDLLKGLRTLCIKRKILLLGLLTSGVLEKSLEGEILDLVDGVLVFELVTEKDSITRWMYFRKFLGVLPKLESERILKYNIRLDPSQGFTISRVMRIL